MADNATPNTPAADSNSTTSSAFDNDVLALLDDIPGEASPGDASEGDNSLDPTDPPENSPENPPENPEEESEAHSDSEDSKAQPADKPDDKSPKVADLVRREARLRSEREAFKLERQEHEPLIAATKQFVDLVKTDIVSAIKMAGYTPDEVADALYAAFEADGRVIDGKVVGVQKRPERAAEERLAALEKKLQDQEAGQTTAQQQAAQRAQQQEAAKHQALIESKLESNADKWPTVYEQLDGATLVHDTARARYADLFAEDPQAYGGPKGVQRFINEELDGVIDAVESELAKRKQSRLKKKPVTEAQADASWLKERRDSEREVLRQNRESKVTGPKTLSNRLGASPSPAGASKPELTDDEFIRELAGMVQ